LQALLASEIAEHDVPHNNGKFKWNMKSLKSTPNNAAINRNIGDDCGRRATLRI